MLCLESRCSKISCSHFRNHRLFAKNAIPRGPSLHPEGWVGLSGKPAKWGEMQDIGGKGMENAS